MQHYLNNGLVKRNSLIGRGMVFLGLGTLLVGFLLSFSRPQDINLVFIGALSGTLFSQIGLQLTNRWGRHPRDDEVINDALKGLDDRYAVFHYALGTSHALFGPTGAFAIVPNTEAGEITHTDGAWSSYREKSGILRRPRTRLLRGLAARAKAEADDLLNSLTRRGHAENLEGVAPVMLFANPAAQVSAAESEVPAVHVKKLKEWLRRQPKRKSLPPEEVQALAAELGLV